MDTSTNRTYWAHWTWLFEENELTVTLISVHLVFEHVGELFFPTAWWIGLKESLVLTGLSNGTTLKGSMAVLTLPRVSHLNKTQFGVASPGRNSEYPVAMLVRVILDEDISHCKVERMSCWWEDEVLEDPSSQLAQEKPKTGSGHDNRSWSLAEAHAKDGDPCRQTHLQEVWTAEHLLFDREALAQVGFTVFSLVSKGGVWYSLR